MWVTTYDSWDESFLLHGNHDIAKDNRFCYLEFKQVEPLHKILRPTMVDSNINPPNLLGTGGSPNLSWSESPEKDYSNSNAKKNLGHWLDQNPGSCTLLNTKMADQLVLFETFLRTQNKGSHRKNWATSSVGLWRRLLPNYSELLQSEVQWYLSGPLKTRHNALTSKSSETKNLDSLRGRTSDTKSKQWSKRFHICSYCYSEDRGFNLAVCQNLVPLFCSHQNSWDLWMFIPLKMYL